MIKFLTLLCLILPLSVSAQEMKLLTWNVFMFPKPIRFSKQTARMKVIAKQLKQVDHDIIFLQEAFSFVFRAKISRALRKKWPHQAVLSRGGSGGVKFLNSGLFIASKYPYKILEAENYDFCSGLDCLASKGVMLIEVEHPSGKKVQIATTHIQAGGPEAASAKAKQFQLIKTLLAKHRKEGVAQILTGDLNINANRPEPDSQFAQTLEMLEMTNGPLIGDITYTSSFKVDCFKVKNTNSKNWLDHFLLGANESGVEIVDRKVLTFISKLRGKDCHLSDHYGVEAVVQL